MRVYNGSSKAAIIPHGWRFCSPFLEPGYQALPSFYRSFQIRPSYWRRPAEVAAVTGEPRRGAFCQVVSQRSAFCSSHRSFVVVAMPTLVPVDANEWVRGRQKGWRGAINRSDSAREVYGESGCNPYRSQDLQI